MRVHLATVLLFVFVCLAGCAPPPLVTKGTFTKPYTLTMQREAMDVVVETSGPASYTHTHYHRDHPMGPPSDTEATFTTPAGTFVVSDRNMPSPGLTINGTFYPELDRLSRTTITIDAEGGITVSPPKAPAPQADGP